MLIFGGVSSSSWPKTKGQPSQDTKLNNYAGPICTTVLIPSACFFFHLWRLKVQQMPSNPTQTNTVSFFRLNLWCKMQVLRGCNLVVKGRNWVKPGDLTRALTQLVFFRHQSRHPWTYESYLNCRKPKHITPKASHTCFPPGAKHIHIISYQCQMHGFMKKTHFRPANVSSPGT